MEGLKKRERATNFNPSEVRLLTELVTKYRAIIENKKTDAVTNKEKEAAWGKITSLFNAATGFTSRNVKNLKLKYESIKKDTKKTMAKHRQELYRTGGGPSSGPELTEIQEKVMAICSNITGLDARNDSDSIPAVIPEDPLKMEKIPLQLIDTNIIQIMPNESSQKIIDQKNLFADQIVEEESAVKQAENDQGATDTYQPMQDDIEIVEANKDYNWSSWKPRALKTKTNPALKNQKVSKGGVTATLDKLSKARLELVELQKEIARKEHQFVEEQHHLKMKHLENDERRKQELHEILVRQLNNRDSYQTSYNVLG